MFKRYVELIKDDIKALLADRGMFGGVDIDEVIERQVSCFKIYGYEEAMVFLSEQDASLVESLEIAFMYGYDNINSEILANLLLRERLLSYFPILREEILEEMGIKI